MKIKKFKLFTILIGALLLNTNTFAQSANDQILSGVETPGDYETIQLAQMDANLSTFMNLVALSDFGASWKLTDEEHTVFLPTNQAFNEMSVERFTHLTDPKNKADLVRFVKYHFIPGKASQSDFEDADIIDTQSQDKITVYAGETFNTVYVGGAKVIKTMEASDGIVHIVNGVVEPNEDFLMLN